MPAIMSRRISPVKARWIRSAILLDCTILLILSSVLRFFWLNRSSLWADEIFSVYWSQLDPAFLLGQGEYLEANPPAYYILLRAWTDNAGTSVFAVRAFSVVCSIPPY